MKAIQIENAFGLQNLTYSNCIERELKNNEVQVKMEAASLNYRDLLMVKGMYNPKQPLPLVPCSDGAGRVVAVGKDIHHLHPGDLVTTTFAPHWQSGTPSTEQMRYTMGGPINGALSQNFIADSSHVLKAPTQLTAIEASTLPCAALTAWNALVEVGKIKAGDKVLIQGTGGVALFALQFAKMFGAEVVILSSSNEKLQRVREMGADHTINYSEIPKWSTEVRNCVDQIDIVVELGGAQTLSQSLRVCRPGGTIALIGILSGVAKEINLLPIIMNKINLSGIFVGSCQHFQDMNKAIAQNNLKPVIDKVFPFSEAVKAFEYLESAAHFGKICIDLQS